MQLKMATAHVSKMILAVHSDASYLSEPDSKSHVGGHYFLIDQDSNAPNNGTILSLAAIIKHVVSSASEAELAALFNNFAPSTLNYYHN